jgi:hypothetical protein
MRGHSGCAGRKSAVVAHDSAHVDHPLRDVLFFNPDTSYNLGRYANVVDTTGSRESLWLELKCGFRRGIQAAR